MTKHTEKPETRTSGFSPAKPAPSGHDILKPLGQSSGPLPEAKVEPVKDIVASPATAKPTPGVATPTQPTAWATGHGDERSRRLTLTVDGQNYNGTVLEPHDRAAVAKMLAELADKVRVGVA